MIKINLLPFRAARTRENIRRQVSVYVLVIIFVSLSMTWYNIKLSGEVKALSAEYNQVKSRYSAVKRKARKVDEIKKKRKILGKKIEIIRGLEEKRDEPLNIFDEMTKVVIAQRMWLEKMEIGESSVHLSGTAMDEITVADFLKRLEKSEFFGDVSLKNLKLKVVNKVNMKSFDIVCVKQGSFASVKS